MMAIGKFSEQGSKSPPSSLISREFGKYPALLLAASLLGACGGTDPNEDTSNTADGVLLPLETGNTWTYRVTDNIEVTTKITTVGDETTVGGGPTPNAKAYEVTTRKGTNMMDKTVSYQAPLSSDPQIIIRYRELSYGAMTGMLELEEYWDPYRLHIDGSAAHMKTGLTYADDYNEIKVPAGEAAKDPVYSHDIWTVVDLDTSITVAVGTADEHTYEHTVHLSKLGGSDNTKDYWYKRGVGKVKEVGSQTEELIAYTVADKNGQPL